MDQTIDLTTDQTIDQRKILKPLDFSKANETVFSTSTADNNSTIEKSGTPATPEKITDEQSLLEETTGIPNDFSAPGYNKAKIWESYNIYFPKNVISYIERKSSISPDISDWKALVKEALLEIYQSEITNFSAKGTRLNKNVGIDPQVFRAILGWAQSRTKETISETEFVNYINKFIGNKRQSTGKIKPQGNKVTITKHSESDSCEPKTNYNFPEKEDEFLHENDVNLHPLDMSTFNVNVPGQFNDNVNWNLNYSSASREYSINLINDNVFQQSMNILHDDYEEENPSYLNL
ncbi:Protein of unknown function [Cotesia congregata]|uniref:Uncharacterized protein n=1 Tax=Cotesia congregata TaxID=51543 RepID=A0A8J2MDU3_COTCN|nr:Protein of unknown function [Cotesia congregata]